MRIARRHGPVADFAADSTTSPQKMAPIGITLPSTRVAIVSLASTLVPTGALPATIFSRSVTGNSCTTEVRGTGGFGAGSDWPHKKAEKTAGEARHPTTKLRLDNSDLLRLAG